MIQRSTRTTVAEKNKLFLNQNENGTSQRTKSSTDIFWQYSPKNPDLTVHREK